MLFHLLLKIFTAELRDIHLDITMAGSRTCNRVNRQAVLGLPAFAPTLQKQASLGIETAKAKSVWTAIDCRKLETEIDLRYDDAALSHTTTSGLCPGAA